MLLAPTLASATIVYVTVTGTVAIGTDSNGLFSTVGANLAGDAYTAQYEFDTSLGQTYTDATASYAIGGSAYPAPYTTSPSLGASLTIKGKSISIAGTFSGSIFRYNAPNSEYHVEADSSNSVYLYNEMIGNPETNRFYLPRHTLLLRRYVACGWSGFAYENTLA